jgi:hypothetical protein
MNAWQLKKKASWYDRQATFRPDEIREMNAEAYELGAAHVLEATAQLYGLGPKRLAETQETLERTSYRELHEYAEGPSPLDWQQRLPKTVAAQMNQEAYRLGVEHTRESVGYAYRLGDTRLARINEPLAQLQAADLGPLERNGNVYEARRRWAERRAKQPTRKGAVLNGKPENE